MRADADKCKLICSYCEPKSASNASMGGFKCEPLQLGGAVQSAKRIVILFASFATSQTRFLVATRTAN